MTDGEPRPLAVASAQDPEAGLPPWLLATPAGDVGARLHRLFSAASSADPELLSAQRFGGVARWEVVRQWLWPASVVLSVQLGRLSSPLMRYAVLGPEDRVLTGAPAAFQAVCAAEGVVVDSLDAVRVVAGAFLEWVRPLDGSVAIAEDAAGLARVERVVSLLTGGDGALTALRRLARLVDGTEAERAATVAQTLAGADLAALPARALSLDEALRLRATTPPAAGWAAWGEAPAGLADFVVFERGRVVWTGAVPAPDPELAPTPRLPYGAEPASWDALAGALGDLLSARATRIASWNGYRGRLVALLSVERAPVFMELRVERDGRVRARALPVG